MTRAVAAAAPFPGWCGQVLRGSSPAVGRARAEFPQRSISLRAEVLTEDAQFRCGGAIDAPPLRRRRPAHACTHCSEEDRPKSRPSLESWCDLQSAYGWIQPKRANEGIDSSGLYLRAGAPAADAQSRCKETRTGLLRSAQ